MNREILFNIAKIIDNDFIGTEKTFTCERKAGYYFLNTNKCDHASLIKVYSDLYDNDKISQILVLADDEHLSYHTIHNDTMTRINNYLSKLKQ